MVPRLTPGAVELCPGYELDCMDPCLPDGIHLPSKTSNLVGSLAGDHRFCDSCYLFQFCGNRQPAARISPALRLPGALPQARLLLGGRHPADVCHVGHLCRYFDSALWRQVRRNRLPSGNLLLATFMDVSTLRLSCVACVLAAQRCSLGS